MRVAGLVAGLLACETKPRQPVASAQPPDANLTLLRQYLAARDAADEPMAMKILSPTIVAQAGDPSTPTDFGRAAILASWKARVGRSKDACTLELALATEREAVGVALCTTEVTAKHEPIHRTRTLFRVYELSVGDDGKIDRVTMWWDNLRSLRQIGALEDADARPDVTTGRSLAVLGHTPPEEAANAERARNLIAAFDRGDGAAIARAFAVGYVHRDLTVAEPIVFASADDAMLYFEQRTAGCDASPHRVLSVLAVGAWVVVRFTRGCRSGADQSIATHIWIAKFAGDQLVEGWDIWSRQEERRQQRKLSLVEQRVRLEKAGLL